MPVSYNISSDLKLVIYYASGVVTSSEIITASERAILDKRRVSDLMTIIDFSDAVENVQLEEWHELTRRVDEMIEKGIFSIPFVMISNSTSMQLLVDMFNLWPHKALFRMVMVSTIGEAISLLGLSESKEEVIQLWNECKALKRK